MILISFIKSKTILPLREQQSRARVGKLLDRWTTMGSKICSWICKWYQCCCIGTFLTSTSRVLNLSIGTDTGYRYWCIPINVFQNT